jgi:hypothetical protein
VQACPRIDTPSVRAFTRRAHAATRVHAFTRKQLSVVPHASIARCSDQVHDELRFAGVIEVKPDVGVTVKERRHFVELRAPRRVLCRVVDNANNRLDLARRPG